MITVEHEFGEDIITIIDPDGRFNDIEVILRSDTFCYLRQYNDTDNKYEVITCSPVMVDMLMRSYSLKEGVYVYDANGNV